MSDDRIEPKSGSEDTSRCVASPFNASSILSSLYRYFEWQNKDVCCVRPCNTRLCCRAPYSRTSFTSSDTTCAARVHAEDSTAGPANVQAAYMRANVSGTVHFGCRVNGQDDLLLYDSRPLAIRVVCARVQRFAGAASYSGKCDEDAGDMQVVAENSPAGAVPRHRSSTSTFPC